MDLGLSVTSLFSVTQGFAQAVGKRAGVNESVDRSGAEARREASQRALLNPATAEAQRDEAARKQDPSAAQASTPGVVFEYEGRQRIMKVNNQKGALIYQVPSRGQLALIEAEENDARKVRLTA